MTTRLETTQVLNTPYGWRADTIIALPQCQLRFTTMKRFNLAIATDVVMVSAESFVLLNDFYEVVLRENLPPTRQNIIDQHTRALARLPEVIARLKP